MTRFATFWMDDGEIVAPVNVLRFDDTAYHLLGDHLEGLTDTTEVLLDAASYGERSTTAPGSPAPSSEPCASCCEPMTCDRSSGWRRRVRTAVRSMP